MWTPRRTALWRLVFHDSFAWEDDPAAAVLLAQ
jgi:hypothetical protein